MLPPRRALAKVNGIRPYHDHWDSRIRTTGLRPPELTSNWDVTAAAAEVQPGPGLAKAGTEIHEGIIARSLGLYL
jgi:hypothetical protein